MAACRRTALASDGGASVAVRSAQTVTANCDSGASENCHPNPLETSGMRATLTPDVADGCDEIKVQPASSGIHALKLPEYEVCSCELSWAKAIPYQDTFSIRWPRSRSWFVLQRPDCGGLASGVSA